MKTNIITTTIIGLLLFVSQLLIKMNHWNGTETITTLLIIDLAVLIFLLVIYLFKKKTP